MSSGVEKMVLLKAVALILASMFILCAQAQPADPDLHRLVTRLYVEGKLHGGIHIAEGDEVLLSEAWGIADDEGQQVLTPDHTFGINSLGKMFTSILIMQMVEEGILALDDPLSEHYPAFGHPRSGDITIHQLLSHRSGLPDYAMAQITGIMLSDIRGIERLSAVAAMSLDFEPDTRFNYSNTGFYLLGLIIERYREDGYGNQLRKRILEPLEMHHTAHDPKEATTAMPVYYMGDGSAIREVKGSNLEPGDGGVSTMQDLHKFLSALGSEALLTADSWNRMFTPHSLPSESIEGAWPPPHQEPYGYGFSIMELPYAGSETARAVGHGGAGLGSNYVVRYLDSPRIVIVWNNIFKNPVIPEVFEFLAISD
ncbi:MAG: serine hydrolase domain-containing protein [Wenzhouxiangella sp.]|jgi:CubicO group peptidase (beta-lactamase class C family)|nr:serine hydrolase domain-containing protein [Wenzhouxiangella sp.]